MYITVTEPSHYDAYSILVDKFQTRMRDEKHERHAGFSDEREEGKPDVRRFIATNGHGMVVGWMTIKIQDEDVQIEGICTDPVKENSKGAAKALVTRAVNCSFQIGKGGVVSLTNMSRGTGDRFYEYMGFKYTEPNNSKMRVTVDYTIWDVKTTGEEVETKRGKKLKVVEHYRKESM